METYIIVLLIVVILFCISSISPDKKQKVYLRYSTFSEKRKNQRCSTNNSIRLFISQNDNDLFQGWVADISVTGICIVISANEISQTIIGDMFNVKNTTCSKNTWCEIKVKNIVKEPSNWRIGCEFIAPLNNLKEFFQEQR